MWFDLFPQGYQTKGFVLVVEIYLLTVFTILEEIASLIASDILSESFFAAPAVSL